MRQFVLIGIVLLGIVWGLTHLLFGMDQSNSANDIEKMVRGFRTSPDSNFKASSDRPESVARAFSQSLETASQQRPSASFDEQLKALNRDQDDLGRALSDYLKIQLDPDSPESLAIRNGPRAEEVRIYLEQHPVETTSLVFQVLDQVAYEDSVNRTKLINFYRNLSFQNQDSAEIPNLVSQWGKSQDWQDPRRRIELTQITDILRLHDTALAQQTILQIKDRYHGNREMMDYLNSQFAEFIAPDQNF